MSASRFLFYILAGGVSALLGLSISQVLIIDIGQFLKKIPFFRELFYNFSFPPDLILLPIVAGCLATAMVGAEMYFGRPTRYKLKSFQRLLPRYLIPAVVSGLATGLVSALLSWLLYATDIASGSVRVTAWTFIGLLIGLGESLSWRVRSIEGETSKANLRLIKSTVFGFIAGLLAAILIEIIRQPLDLKGWEDFVGFLILGFSLGAFLSIGTASTYQAALRAGRGFEFYDRKPDRELPEVKNKLLRFVTEDTEDDEDMIIEEGLSIELPSNLKKRLKIGSSTEADIYIPKLTKECASIRYKNGKYILQCHAENKVQINRDNMIEGDRVTLRHNQIVTLYHAENDKKFYRFVFYDRFLDPQA